MGIKQIIKLIEDNIIDPVGDWIGSSEFAKEAEEWRDNGFELTRPVYDRDRESFNYRNLLKHTHKGTYDIAQTPLQKILRNRDADSEQTAKIRQALKDRAAGYGLKPV